MIILNWSLSSTIQVISVWFLQTILIIDCILPFFAGVFFLYIKTIERAHRPNDLWEKIKLPRNYEKAMEIIDKHMVQTLTISYKIIYYQIFNLM